MRLLIITSRLPFPPSWGAAARDYNLARHLARRNEVTMLCYAHANEGAPAATLRQQLDDLVTVPLPARSAAQRRITQACTLFSSRPFAALEGRDPSLQQALDILLATRQFDLVQIESVRMNAVRLPRGLPRVIDEHNVEYELLHRVSRGERSLIRRAFNAIEYRKLKKLEVGSWKAATGCLVTSDREATIVRSQAPHSAVMTIPNGVDTDYFRPTGHDAVPDTIVFTGNLSYRPNIDAVHYLVEEIYPLIRERRPHCAITIVGGGARTLLSLEGPGVHFTGFVPDLRPYLQRAAVAVAPIRMGSGTRLKIVEAFAMGKPVVSTSLGVEGIDAQDGKHLLIGDSSPSFAAKVVELLEDPAARQRLGANAMNLAREQYSWVGVARRLEDFYAELTQPARNALVGRP